MMINSYFNQYQANQVQTASPEKILVMLYDGAIRFVRQGREGILEANLAFKSEGIRKAIAIITELSNTLDHEVGGEIASNLDGLYHFMCKELARANLKNIAEPLDVVETILTDLRGTWVEAIEIVRKERIEISSNQRISAAL